MIRIVLGLGGRFEATVGGRCDARKVNQHRLSEARSTETIVAELLHVTDVVDQDGALQRVTSLRLQGAPPLISVAFAGVAGRRCYAPGTPVRVLRRRGG